MKIKLFVVLLLFLGTLKVRAQSKDTDIAYQIVNALRGQNYDSLQSFISPGSIRSLTPDVFIQIRQAMIFKNSEVNTDEFTVTASGDNQVLKAKVLNPALSLNLVFVFNKTHQLTQFYLEPFNYGMGRYKNPVYTDSTLYEEKTILVQTGQFILPGTLTIPKGKKNFPILVFVHGSGSLDRNEGLFTLKPFRDIAIGLAAKGIASLRYDKRYRIYGEAAAAIPGKLLSINEETTADAKSAISLASTIAGVNVKQIFLIGHSLGGMMTPRIVTENPVLAGAVFMSGPARSFLQSMEDQYHKLPMNPSIADALRDIEEIKHMDTLQDKSKMLLQKPAAYWIGLNNYKQLEVVKTLKQPLLFLQGERDYQVPPSEIGRAHV